MGRRDTFHWGLNQARPVGARSGLVVGGDGDLGQARAGVRQADVDVLSRPSRRLGSAERQVIDAVGEIGRLPGARDQLQVGDALSERHVQLVRVDHSGKRDARTLSADRFGKEVGLMLT